MVGRRGGYLDIRGTVRGAGDDPDPRSTILPPSNPRDRTFADILALGYLVGPTIGSMLYSLTHPTLSRGNPSPLEVMDRAFFDHIKANRASPAFQSVNNPAPDFYGEKVCLSMIYDVERTNVTLLA
jgi:hypothetical protein